MWRFPTTKRMSTYITALIAGEYHAVHDTYEGKNGTIELGHFCRQSLVEHLDRDEVVKITKQGFEFFEEAFDFPYPFEKYDQLYVPEYNMGAMENAGAVTLRDEYLPRSRQDGSFYEFRASVILHEMAHMWFGDLVTMKWWDDLWLNESFAEWACYHAAVENTEFTESWTGFTNARKNWALRQDQLPSTHPIAADNHDLQAVEVNFDGITYAKGASVLKQLVAWVGLDAFLAGLRQYFKDHAYANSEFTDLLTALEKASGRELDSWAKEWLQTSGVNTLAAEFELDADGAYSSFAVRQTAAADYPTLRRHRIGIGLYDERATAPGPSQPRRGRRRGRAHRRSTSSSASGSPTCCCSTTATSTYAKIRLDERSLATAGRRPATARRLARPGAVLGRRVGHDPRRRDERDRLRRRSCSPTSAPRPTPSAPPGSRCTPRRPCTRYSAPANRAGAARPLGVRRARAADVGRGRQRPPADLRAAYAAAAHTDAGARRRSQGLLDGTWSIDGLAVDTDLRWALVTRLARAGRFGADEIAEELERDNTISGQEHAAAALTSRPTAEAKAEAWDQATVQENVPNETHRSICLSFMRYGQEDLLAPYVEKYLEAADDIWERLGTQQGVHGARVHLPEAAGQPGAARPARRLAGVLAGQPRRQALRPRGPRRRRPRAAGAGPRRPGLTALSTAGRAC